MERVGSFGGGRSGGSRYSSSGGSRYGRSSSGDSRTGGRQGGRNREGQEGRGGSRFLRKKVCRLCTERAPGIDYKDVERLLKFLTEKGKILPSRISGNCAPHQRMLTRAIKKARHASLIGFQLGV